MLEERGGRRRGRGEGKGGGEGGREEKGEEGNGDRKLTTIHIFSSCGLACLTEVGVLEGGEGGTSDETKVSDLHSTVQREEDVGGFQISVHHALTVNIQHRIQRLRREEEKMRAQLYSLQDVCSPPAQKSA